MNTCFCDVMSRVKVKSQEQRNKTVFKGDLSSVFEYLMMAAQLGEISTYQSGRYIFMGTQLFDNFANEQISRSRTQAAQAQAFSNLLELEHKGPQFQGHHPTPVATMKLYTLLKCTDELNQT